MDEGQGGLGGEGQDADEEWRASGRGGAGGGDTRRAPHRRAPGATGSVSAGGGGWGGRGAQRPRSAHGLRRSVEPSPRPPPIDHWVPRRVDF